jgi:RNA polymerase sigma factor (sigma-70 family)
MTPSLLRMAGDERLARMVTAGHDQAFATLYDRYRDVLVRYCRSLVRDDQDALDAFQSAMLNALRALRDDRRRAPVRPWLFRIAHNESVSVLRRRPAAEPLDDRQIGTVDVHRTAEDREALAGLLEDLEGLTAHQRGALLLRELGGLAYEDVADVLETTPLAARQAVFAARASLHDQRAGRELPCAMVQRRLSDGDRRASRTRAVRAHLRGCDDCRGFASAIGRRRRAAVLVPIPPAFASSGLLASVLDGAGGSVTTAGGGLVATGLVAKAAVALSAAVVATGAAERPAAVKEQASAPPTTTKATTPRRATTSAAATAHPAAASAPVAKAPTTAKHTASHAPVADEPTHPTPISEPEREESPTWPHHDDDARPTPPAFAAGPRPNRGRPLFARTRRPAPATESTPPAPTTPATTAAPQPTAAPETTTADATDTGTETTATDVTTTPTATTPEPAATGDPAVPTTTTSPETPTTGDDAGG